MLPNTSFKYYDAEVLRLQKETRTKYHEQVDRLIATLSATVKEKTKIKITRVVKAGSFAKFTILRKSVDNPVDVDVVFYISGRNLDSSSFDSLSSDIYDLLIELYPNKAVDDFEIQKRAAKVVFKGSGLEVDIVPVIENLIDSRVYSVKSLLSVIRRDRNSNFRKSLGTRRAIAIGASR